MLSVPHLASAIQHAINTEKKAVEGISFQDICELPTGVLLQAVRKQLWREKDNLFTARVKEYVSAHPFKLFDHSLVFRAGSGDKDACYVLVQLSVKPEKEHFEDAVKKYFDHSFKNCRAFYGMLLHGNQEEIQSWQLLQENTLLGLANLAASPSPLSQAADGKDYWLLLWEIKLQESKDDADKDMTLAMQQAVESMKYENMLAVIRKIISLRTHIPEEKIEEESALSTLFKMSFALEQGVPPEEVYDPEAFNGLTDTQLASKNLIDDLQKTFCFRLEAGEENCIRTVADLTRLIVSKTS